MATTGLSHAHYLEQQDSSEGGVHAVEPRVFICHSSADAATALEVAEALDAAGVPSWIAPRNVPAGALFLEAVITALTKCEATALLLSPAAMNSRHVLSEMTVALEHDRLLFVFATDEAALHHSELPLRWQLLLAVPQVVRFPGASQAAAAIVAVVGVGGSTFTPQPRPPGVEGEGPDLQQPRSPGGWIGDLLTIKARPEIVALVERVMAHSGMHHEYLRASGYISLRKAQGGPVKAYVRRSHVSLPVTPALAKLLLAEGVGAIERSGGHTVYVKVTAPELAFPQTLDRVADILAAREWTKGTLAVFLGRLTSSGHGVQAKAWTAAVANGGVISRDAVLDIAGLDPTHSLTGFTTSLNNIVKKMRDSSEIPQDAVDPFTPIFEGAGRAKGFRVPDSLVTIWKDR